MKLDHVVMYVNDLEAEKNFFVKYFNAKSGSKYSNFRNDFSNYFLKFDDGSRLEIMTRSISVDANKVRYRTGYHHIAINVGSNEEVDKITSEMEDDSPFIFSAN